MSVTVSTDLLVTTAPNRVEQKLEERRLILQESLRKGEPKVFGVTQIALGLMIISYSLPLLFNNTTLIMKIGVPWWSGLMFVFSGATAIAVEKKTMSMTINVCLSASIMAIIVAVVAFALYYIDSRQDTPSDFCSDINTIITILFVTQAAVSSAFTAILYKAKKEFNYVSMND